MSVPWLDYTRPLGEYHPLADFVGTVVPLLIADWRRWGIVPTSFDISAARDAWMAMIDRGEGEELLFRVPGRTGQTMGLLLRVLTILAFAPGGVWFCGHHFEAKGNDSE